MNADYTRSQVREGKVPVSTKIYQGIGALPDTYKNFAFNTFLLFYYNQVLGMPAVNASAALMLALIIDAVTDPLVGSYSDGLQTRLGRRHPLMYFSALPLGLSLFLVFSPPASFEGWQLTAWLTVFAIAVRTSMTFFQVPWGALFAEFTENYEERSSIITFRYLCGWIGGVALTWCTWTYIFPTTEAYTPGHLNPAGYEQFAVVLAILVTLSVFLTTHLTRREVPYLLQPRAPAAFSLRLVWNDLVLALQNRDFMVLFGGLLLSSILGGTLTTLEIYLNTYFWGLLPEDLRWFILTIVGSMLAFLAVPFLQHRHDKKHLLVFFMMFLLINGIAVVCLRFADLLPDNGDPMLLYILVANEMIRIFALTIVGIMFVSMVADSLDLQELNTGKRQEGVFSAALSFAGKSTSGVGIMFGGLILQYALQFPEGITPRDAEPELILRLGIVAGVIIPLFYLIPFWLATRYSISRTRYEEIQTQLHSK